MAPRVLLLRTPQETDRYEEALKSAEFCPFSLPVLETMLENREQLFDIVRPKKAEDGRVDEVDGVIVTSARAVEACANAGDIDWREKPFYVVGPATAAALRARLPNPPQDIRGMESGSTEQLAQYIVENATGFKRLLYLTGDKNREKLPRIVMERLGDGVLTKLRVYSTRGVRDFEGSLKRALQGEPVKADDEPWWIVLFAPSAAEHVMPALHKHFSMRAAKSPPLSGWGSGSRRARLAAIGPTTAKFIREDLGLAVDVVAAAPTAESLVSSLLESCI